MALIAISSKRTMRRALILIASINLLFILVHFVANHFSIDGFNESVIAHLKYTLDLKSLIQFWPVTIGTLATLGTLLITALFYDRTLDNLKHKISPTIKAVAICSIPVAVFGATWFNPLIVDLNSLYGQYKRDALVQLPEEFQALSATAPEINHSSPAEKPNFIIIFAESLERPLFDNTTYPNLLEKTNRIVGNHGLTIEGIKELTLSNWTFSGLVAALCGMSMNVNYSEMGTIDQQSPNLIGETCIGDILHQDKYQLGFVGGSDFGMKGKTLLLESQGFSNIHGRQSIESAYQTPVPASQWGIYDQTLFDYSRNVLSDLVDNSTEPFGLVILTVDTHNPSVRSPQCSEQTYADGSSDFLNSVKCTDSMLSEFIGGVLTSEEHKDTVVFLISDHLYPHQTLPNNSLKRIDRDNMFHVFNSKFTHHGATSSVKRLATPLDLAPTILANLGYTIESLNFGRNLMIDKPTLAEAMGHSTLSSNIVPLRHQMNDSWKEHKAR